MVAARAFKKQTVNIVPEHSYQEIMAIKAVAQGVASAQQQVWAMDWIIKKAGMIGGLSYNPNHPNEIFINDGRRFVAVCLMEMIAEPIHSVDRRFPGPKTSREPKYPEEEATEESNQTEE